MVDAATSVAIRLRVNNEREEVRDDTIEVSVPTHFVLAAEDNDADHEVRARVDLILDGQVAATQRLISRYVIDEIVTVTLTFAACSGFCNDTERCAGGECIGACFVAGGSGLVPITCTIADGGVDGGLPDAPIDAGVPDAIDTGVDAPDSVRCDGSDPRHACFDDIDGSRLHVCGIRDGAVRCWGRSSDGRAGVVVSDIHPYANAPVEGSWSRLRVGRNATCAWSSDGVVNCLGRAVTGDGASFSHLPQPMLRVASGMGDGRGWDDFVTTRDGDAYAGCGLRGGTLDGFVGPEGPNNFPTNDGGGDWTGRIETSDRHGCGIRYGQAWCWGSNKTNRAGGEGSTSHRVDGVPDGATQVTVAVRHGCAIADGDIYCWGSHFNGRLGAPCVPTDFDGEDGCAPVEVAAAPDPWVQVSAGEHHTCAITTGGDLYCWGGSETGKTGQPRVGSDSCPCSGGAMCPCTPAPTKVEHEFRWADVVATDNGTCALDERGLAYCFGRWGALGNGSSSHSFVPVPVLLEP